MIHDYSLGLFAERGYIASSNWRDSDGPFIHELEGKKIPLVELPKDSIFDDTAYDFYTDSAPERYELKSPGEMLEIWKEEFDSLAAEGRMSAAEVCYYTGISMASLRGLEKAGIVAFSEEEELRLPDLNQVEPAGPIVLNEEQEAAFQSILDLTRTGRPEAVLLQGSPAAARPRSICGWFRKY